jgi:hypothetical protein
VEIIAGSFLFYPFLPIMRALASLFLAALHRVPMFLATSFSEAKALEFADRAHRIGKMPSVLWHIQVRIL